MLSKRQQEWVARPRPAKETVLPAETVVLSVRERLVKLRKELNTLVALHNHRTNKPHGMIHNELRRQCGGPPTAMATIEQLEERIAVLRGW